MGRSYAGMFFAGFSAIVGGFGVGYVALAAVPAHAPKMASVGSPVTWTASAPRSDVQPPTVAPRVTAAKPEAERAAPAPKRTAEAPPARGDAPTKSKRGPMRIETPDGSLSASVDPDTRKLRIRTPYGSYSFGM